MSNDMDQALPHGCPTRISVSSSVLDLAVSVASVASVVPHAVDLAVEVSVALRGPPWFNCSWFLQLKLPWPSVVQLQVTLQLKSPRPFAPCRGAIALALL